MGFVNRKMNRITAWILMVLCVCSTLSGTITFDAIKISAQENTTHTISESENYYLKQMRRMLGDVKNFGAFAETLSVESDFESNFAVNTIYGNNHGIGNTAGTYTNVGGTCYIGDSIETIVKARSPINNIVLGFDVSKRRNSNTYYTGTWLNAVDVINVDSSPNVQIIKNKSYIDVTAELAEVNAIFTAYKSIIDTDGVIYNYNDQNNSIINVKNCAANICYVSITAEKLSSLGTGALNIEKNDGQIVIVNVTNSNQDITLNKFRVNGVDSSSPTIEMSDSIYWNVTECTKTVKLMGTCGVFIAPDAAVSIGATSAGRIIANQIKNPGGELHFIAADLEPEYDPDRDDFWIQKSLGDQLSDSESDGYQWNIEFEVGGNATDIVITDEVADEYFKYADELKVQYAISGNGEYNQWIDTSTNTGNAVYYQIEKGKANGEGGTLKFIVKSNKKNTTTKIRFNVAANKGVYSNVAASQETPDLPTNDTAEVSYKDVNAVQRSYTSKSPDSYGKGTCLDTPYVYIPITTHGLHLNKNASENADGTWTLNLETYTTGMVKTIQSSKPADIVLTIDTSGSMFYTMGDAIRYEDLDTKKEDYYYRLGLNNNTTSYNNCLRFRDGQWEIYKENDWYAEWSALSYSDYNYRNKTYYVTRIGALKESAAQFVEAVAADCINIDTGITNKHRIAVTAFSNNAGEVVSTFLDVSNENNRDSIIDKINALTPAGGTCTAGGLQKAYNLFQANALNSDSRTKAEILFTDGEPTYHLTKNWSGNYNGGYDGSGNSFDTEGANQAIQFAKKIEGDYNASIYTIGIFPGADPDNTSNNNRFMNYASSNYPSAASMSSGGAEKKSGFYLAASDAAELSNVFQSISNSITEIGIELGVNTELKDFITDTFIASGNQGNIKAYTYECIGKNENDEPIWSEQPTEITASLNITLYGNEVTVKGFDYKENAVLMGDVVSGKKLVVTIDIQRNKTTYGGNNIATNTIESGIYDEEGNIVDAFPVPTVNVPLLYGIKAKDKSIYITGNTNTNDLASVVGTDSDDYGTEVEVAGLPDGVNNRYVNMVYNIKDSKGNVLFSKSVDAGMAAAENPFTYGLDGLTEDTAYYFEATLTSSNEAVTGFTPANEKKLEDYAAVHVFKPVISCNDQTIFYGESIQLSNQLGIPVWRCGHDNVSQPVMEAPELAYAYSQMVQGEDELDCSSVEPAESMNFKITSVKANDQEIISYTTVNRAVCSAMEQDHIDERDFSIHVVKGQLNIQKTINKQYSNIRAINANATFVYRIEQYAVNEDGTKGELAAVFYQTLGFDANEDNDFASVTVSGLKKGYYTITEETAAALKYRLVKKSDNAGNTAENAGTDLYIGNQTGINKEEIMHRPIYYGLEQNSSYASAATGDMAVVQYENELNNWKYLSDSAAAVNWFVR